jgi:glycosyltransferase involved in cell wall biosynthesis
MSLPKVSVLLATFNGEKYIEEFLDSLADQVGVEVNLYVSDDGSTDRTLEIIETFINKFKTVKFLEGPKLGPSRNFLHLLQNAQGNFFSFADQDDIWLPEKLLQSVQAIDLVDCPCLFTSSVADFNGSRISRKPFRMPISIMRNNSQGCTMVFNSELRSLLLNLNAKNLIMHDWVALILAQIHGQVIFHEKPYVHYRLHQNNFVGHQTKFNKIYNYLKSLALPKSKSSVFNQALEIMKTIADPDQNDPLVSWCNSVNSSIVPRFKYLLAHRNVYLREVSTFACALQIIMGKFRR